MGQGLAAGSSSHHAIAETVVLAGVLGGFELAEQVLRARYPRGLKALPVQLNYF